ncbi:hypothetical protein [Micromonospora sp. 067-2]|uniref:hypothetical protein n=1 Tax=Micromonospora sp. 067-2 TaxID=2789270 RepID=UPI0039787602
MTLPDQDPTPEAIQQQGAETLAFEQRFQTSAWIAGALAILGLAAFILARKHRRTAEPFQEKN